MEIKKEDLINPCEKCNGTGYFKETSGAKGGVGITYMHEALVPTAAGEVGL